MARICENAWKQEFDRKCELASLETGEERINVISDIWLGLRERAVTDEMRGYADHQIRELLMLDSMVNVY